MDIAKHASKVFHYCRGSFREIPNMMAYFQNSCVFLNTLSLFLLNIFPFPQLFIFIAIWIELLFQHIDKVPSPTCHHNIELYQVNSSALNPLDNIIMLGCEAWTCNSALTSIVWDSPPQQIVWMSHEGNARNGSCVHKMASSEITYWIM